MELFKSYFTKTKIEINWKALKIINMNSQDIGYFIHTKDRLIINNFSPKWR